jgi:hypothetical protein
MLVDRMHGTIARRILLNYRVEADALRRVLPPPFEPRLHAGVGIAGVCMIRFEGLRPRGLPPILGLASENAAHRIAVTWPDGGAIREGVFIPRRDTGSGLNHRLGGRLFPGIFARRRFEVRETSSTLDVRVTRPDGVAEIVFRGSVCEEPTAGSAFRSLAEAASFLASGSRGYSATRQPGRYQGMELRCDDWTVQPVAVDDARVRFFDDRARFPEGSIQLDSALLMRGVAHEWRSQPDLVI